MQKTDLILPAEISLYYDLFVPEADVPGHSGSSGTASRASVAVCPQPPGSDKRPLLIAVHGYGAHKSYMLREAKRVAPVGWAIASLQGPHQHYRPAKDGGYRVGFGWLTDYNSQEYVRLHHDFVLRVIDKLAGEGTVDRSRVFMFGFSQACALNFRFAFTHPEILKGIVGVCGGIPGDLDTNEKYRAFDAETFYLFGDDDEFYSQEQFAGFDKRLGEMLPNYRSKHYTAKHEITDEMRADISDFLKAI